MSFGGLTAAAADCRKLADFIGCQRHLHVLTPAGDLVAGNGNYAGLASLDMYFSDIAGRFRADAIDSADFFAVGADNNRAERYFRRR